MSKPKKHKPFWAMTARELAAATKQFDREHAGSPGHNLTPADAALHRRAARRGRPVVGAGAERINVTVERSLLKEADVRLTPLRPVTIDVENVTFWEAALKLEELTGITFDGTVGELRLMRGGRPMGGAGQRVSFSGPFMVTIVHGPSGFESSHRLRVFAEPRVRLIRHAMTADVVRGVANPDGPGAGVDLLLPARRAAAAERGKGRGMIDARRGQVFDVLIEPFRAADGMVGPDGRFDARAAAAAAGRRADRLKGSVRAVVLTREDTVEIDDIAKARNAERKVGGRRFVVNAMNPVPGEWNVAGVLYHADPQMAGAADVRFALLDGNGVSLQPLGESRGGGMGGWTGFHLEFRQGPDAGPPAKLRMTMAAETKEIEIPFEFKR